MADYNVDCMNSEHDVPCPIVPGSGLVGDCRPDSERDGPKCPKCQGQVQFTEISYGILDDWDEHEIVSSDYQEWYCENDHRLLVDSPAQTIEWKSS